MVLLQRLGKKGENLLQRVSAAPKMRDAWSGAGHGDSLIATVSFEFVRSRGGVPNEVSMDRAYCTIV